MKLIRPIAASLFVLSLLVSLPFYFFVDAMHFYLSQIFIVVFSLVWLLIYFYVKYIKKSSDDLSLGMKVIGGSIFFKLVMSIVAIIILIEWELFDWQSKNHWLIFALYYFVYTILISYFAVKWIDPNKSNAKLS